ncbi:MAG TPA: TfoX/Sxy family protein [Steroidobacteraceae bacterium]|nr:TfoX/Sxy family protein [Steroidobacteraceae bacterium]
MTASADFIAYVLEQLARLEDVSWRRMFGGAGLYSDGYFFGLISDDTLYLRVDDSNRADYTARGTAPFRPYADRPQLSTTYFATPAEVLEDAEQLVIWARRSLAVAVKAASRGRTAAPGKRPPAVGARGRPRRGAAGATRGKPQR